MKTKNSILRKTMSSNNVLYDMKNMLLQLNVTINVIINGVN